MSRVINFSAGPSALPLPALELAREELLEFESSGSSIMEQSHRGTFYDAVHHEALSLLRELYAVPDDYRVLFLQGGASQQFAQVPLNLLPVGHSADYILTGGWSEKAFEEARRLGSDSGVARVAATARDDDGRYHRIPTPEELMLDAGAAYVHITTNNTLFGTQWHSLPDVGDVALVADASSDILSRPTDISRFGLIYAGAQKNIGPSGVVVVIVREALLAEMRDDIPVIWRYATHAERDSLYHTPPTFGVYMVRNVMRWLRDLGGLEAVARRNEEKGRVIYGALDAMRDFYQAPVTPRDRSLMNVVFHVQSPSLESRFVSEAKAAGMIGLKGHRSVGGLRASIYNAVSVEDVRALADFMGDFARRNG